MKNIILILSVLLIITGCGQKKAAQTVENVEKTALKTKLSLPEKTVFQQLERTLRKNPDSAPLILEKVMSRIANENRALEVPYRQENLKFSSSWSESYQKSPLVSISDFISRVKTLPLEQEKLTECISGVLNELPQPEKYSTVETSAAQILVSSAERLFGADERYQVVQLYTENRSFQKAYDLIVSEAGSKEVFSMQQTAVFSQISGIDVSLNESLMMEILRQARTRLMGKMAEALEKIEDSRKENISRFCQENIRQCEIRIHENRLSEALQAVKAVSSVLKIRPSDLFSDNELLLFERTEKQLQLNNKTGK